jgi:hypothetical protein
MNMKYSRLMAQAVNAGEIAHVSSVVNENELAS